MRRLRPATRTMKNSSRLFAKMERNRARSSRWSVGVLGHLQHAVVEGQPGDLAVGEAVLGQLGGLLDAGSRQAGERKRASWRSWGSVCHRRPRAAPAWPAARGWRRLQAGEQRVNAHGAGGEAYCTSMAARRETEPGVEPRRPRGRCPRRRRGRRAPPAAAPRRRRPAAPSSARPSRAPGAARVDARGRRARRGRPRPSSSRTDGQAPGGVGQQQQRRGRTTARPAARAGPRRSSGPARGGWRRPRR